MSGLLVLPLVSGLFSVSVPWVLFACSFEGWCVLLVFSYSSKCFEP